MIIKYIYSLILFRILKFSKSLDPNPSHFRIVPLSFYTPDKRNDKYFDYENKKYGIRVAWVGSIPPSNIINISNDNSFYIYSWNIQNKFNIHKNEWGRNLWDYSFIDLSLTSGKYKVSIKPWTYSIRIPRFGSNEFNSDANIFIGDPNIASKSQWALGEADKVIKSILFKNSDSISSVFWVGDIFYHDSADIINYEWNKLLTNNNNHISGVTNYLHVALNGNHDYSSVSACHNCIWNIKKDNLDCTSNDQISGIWLQYFFVTDALQSFHQRLSEKYHRSCRVPYEYTFQVLIFGRNGYFIIDNTWSPKQVNINWYDIKERLRLYIDNIFVVGHWDSIHAGSTSSVKDWIHYIHKYFYEKTIIGIQGHTHINNIQDINYFNTFSNKYLSYKLLTVGGNGFKGSGCNCKNSCINCHCCCPTVYSNNKWYIGGWDNDKACNNLKLI